MTWENQKNKWKGENIFLAIPGKSLRLLCATAVPSTLTWSLGTWYFMVTKRLCLAVFIWEKLVTELTWLRCSHLSHLYFFKVFMSATPLSPPLSFPLNWTILQGSFLLVNSHSFYLTISSFSFWRNSLAVHKILDWLVSVCYVVSGSAHCLLTSQLYGVKYANENGSLLCVTSLSHWRDYLCQSLVRICLGVDLCCINLPWYLVSWKVEESW